MRTENIRWFIAVANEGSINRASTRLHTSHQNLGKAISSMESELGLKLVNRDKAGLSLTEEGKFAYEKFAAIDKLYRELEDYASLRQVKSPTAEEKLNLYIAPNLMPNALADCVIKTIEKYPNVSISVDECDTEEALKRAAENPNALCNVVIPQGVSTAHLLDRGFTILMERPLVLNLVLPMCMCDVVKGGKVTIEEVKEIPLAIYDTSNLQNYNFYNSLNGLEDFNVMHVVNYFPIFQKLIESCRYATLLPLYENMGVLLQKYISKTMFDDNAFVFVPIYEKRKKIETKVVWCINRSLSTPDAAKFFLSLL